MSKNIVILIDGTANEISANETNVYRLAGMLVRDPGSQVFHYDPGVGTQGLPTTDTLDPKVIAKVLGLAVGFGLYARVASAYCYLMRVWQTGDNIFLFGFSRGAYAVRVLAGLIDKLGILENGQDSLVPYALKLYADPENTPIANRFKHVFGREADIAFLGLWDTVKSVFEQKSPLMLTSVALPRTYDNASVRIVRHALAIDERRRFFRTNKWTSAPRNKDADIKQVWFAGVHSDIGGGYSDAGLSKISLAWMVREASAAGLLLNQVRVDAIVPPAAMSCCGMTWALDPLHDSLRSLWVPLEWAPRFRRAEHETEKRHWGVWPPPGGRRRPIDEGALVHCTVVERCKSGIGYSPENLPGKYAVEP